MGRRLIEEIKQTKPFSCREEAAFLNLQRTADAFLRVFEAALKPFGLTHTQYNVLRILRGAGLGGLLCREVAERMITRDPDITRLIDRLEARGLVTRSRDTKDRRVILTRITDEGLRLLKELDEPVLEFHRRGLAHLGRKQVQHLIDLLEAARAGSG
ncbi:MAG: MarR family transcriptional regulator [Acidobacteriota bacterium]